MPTLHVSFRMSVPAEAADGMASSTRLWLIVAEPSRLCSADDNGETPLPLCPAIGNPRPPTAATVDFREPEIYSPPRRMVVNVVTGVVSRMPSSVWRASPTSPLMSL